MRALWFWLLHVLGVVDDRLYLRYVRLKRVGRELRRRLRRKERADEEARFRRLLGRLEERWSRDRARNEGVRRAARRD